MYLSRCTRFFLFLVASLIAQYVVQALCIEPNGEIDVWYAISTCFDPNASFTVQGQDSDRTYDAFTMRPIIAGELEGNACPAVSTASPRIDITLEGSDGFRIGGR